VAVAEELWVDPVGWDDMYAQSFAIHDVTVHLLAHLSWGFALSHCPLQPSAPHLGCGLVVWVCVIWGLGCGVWGLGVRDLKVLVADCEGDGSVIAEWARHGAAANQTPTSRP
jgi:hypothetical protein